MEVTKITIHNKRTGEIREVTPDEALALGMSPEKVVAKVEAMEKLQQASQGELLTRTAEEIKTEKKETDAKIVIDQLFDIYYGKEGETPLSLTEPGKWRTPAQLKSLATKVKAGKANSIDKIGRAHV